MDLGRGSICFGIDLLENEIWGLILEGGDWDWLGALDLCRGVIYFRYGASDSSGF